MKSIALIIITIGIVLTIITSFSFFTKEKVVDIGALEITADKPHYLSWSPIIGVFLVGVGGFIYFKSSKN